MANKGYDQITFRQQTQICIKQKISVTTQQDKCYNMNYTIQTDVQLFT